MAFENLPGIFPKLHDGGLAIAAVNENPVNLVIGTASRGPSESFFQVDNVSDAARIFGQSDGTLVRGLYEVANAGGENIRLMRIGATSAKLSNIGGAITIETVSKDNNIGLAYSLFWEDSTARLRVYRTSDNLLVYDNNPAYPTNTVDENELSITGTTIGSPGNIGTLSVPITLADANGISGAVYSTGSDGIMQSRMGLYEQLFVAYKLLENQDIDIVLPQNIFLDDENVQDMTTSEVIASNTGAPWIAGANTYPSAGTVYDFLGKVFAQEYLGEWRFWWDLDRDGEAELYPTVGSASATTDAFGNTLEAGNFHEANFGYQLADFCYHQSEDNAEMIGMIGVLPPLSWSLKDVSNWIGREPTLEEDSAGNSVVSVNGSGLLGNKWMAGRLDLPGNGLPGHIIDGISGRAEGGFIATDSGWPDGEQLKDRNDRLVDIGKYLSVIGAQAILANPTSPSSYAVTGAGAYSGFISTLAANSAPTNKVMPSVRLPFRISVAKLDALAGHRYVMYQAKTKGLVVSDAPTAARPDSDYQRLTTIRIVKATIDALRAAGDPFLGEGITGAQLAALETAINQTLVKLQKAQYLQRFEALVTSTPSQQVQGKADIELVLVPAFELRQITVNVALAAQ